MSAREREDKGVNTGWEKHSKSRRDSGGSCEMQGKAIQVESESRVHAKRKQARRSKSSGCRSRENQFHSACASQEEQQQQRRRRRQQEQRLAFFSVAVCCQAVKWGNVSSTQ
ncbi:uncharacterized protein UHOD_11250 [Ustilago sp. UG-2017b]|nr:uncharacterized protein UHOD_11250 [Ustilago sp. UG-2017b]